MSRLGRTAAALLAAGVVVTGVSVSSSSRSSQPVRAWAVAGAFRGTPVAGVQSVFARTDTGEVVAVDRGTGLVRWRASIARSPGIIAGGRLALTSSAVVAGDDRVEGFDPKTGTRRWVADTESGAGVGIQLGAAQDGQVFAGSYLARLFAIDDDDGRVRWSADLGCACTVFSPRADADGVVAAFSAASSSGEGGVAAFDLAGRTVWRVGMGGGGAMGPVLLSGRIVAAADRHGAIHGFSRATGQALWTIPAPPGRDSREDFRPLASAPGVLVAGSLTGEVMAYDLATRQERWRAWPADASVAFGLAIDTDVVWVPYVSGRVVALELGTGRLRWRFGDGGEGFRWVPLVHGPDVVFAGASGGLVAFRQ